MAVSTEITPLYRVEAFFYNLFMDRFARMPFDKASDAGAGWLRTLGPLTPAHTTAMNNLRMAYPNESERWRHDVADGCWANLGRVTAEFPHLPEINFAPGNGRVELRGEEHLAAVRESGKGAVFISGHFASYEIMPIAIVQSGVKCVMTYRPANNPIIDKKWLATRLQYGAKMQAAKSREGGMGLLRALKRGESVALMNDQKYNEGVAAPFFGHDAMTADGPARLAYQFDVPLLPMSVRRVGQSARFIVEAHAPIPLNRALPEAETIKDAVVRVNQFVEAQVRAAPEQWFWVHNRWPKSAWRDAGVIS